MAVDVTSAHARTCKPNGKPSFRLIISFFCKTEKRQTISLLPPCAYAAHQLFNSNLILIMFQTKRGKRQSLTNLGKKSPIFADFCNNTPCSSSIYIFLFTFCIQQESPCPCTASLCTGGCSEIDYTKTGLAATRFCFSTVIKMFVILKVSCQETQQSGFANGEVQNTDGTCWWTL